MQRKIKKEVTDKLQQNLIKANGKKFWRCWKGAFSKVKSNNMIVNDLHDDSHIANYLSDHFQAACSPNTDSKQLHFMNEYFMNKAVYCGSADSIPIDVELVSKAIDHIEHNKAPGFHSLTIEHIAYAQPSIVVIL